MNTKAHPIDTQTAHSVEPTEVQASAKVLVVDDSRMQCRLLAAALGKWGYQVVTALSGHEALDLCRDTYFDIIISDWIMPGMSGPEFCEAFRQIVDGSKEGGYSYFVLLTSKDSADEIATGLNSGADDFLTKPVGLSELKARLAAGERIVQMQTQLSDKNQMLNAALGKINGLYDDLQRDLNHARQLQQSLVRDTDISIDAGRISMMLRPSGHVGGDLVGAFRINEDTQAVYALDVSGHGVSSALLTARLAGCLSGAAPRQNIGMHWVGGENYTPVPPEQIAQRLNTMLLEELETDHYVTLAIALIDLPSGKATCLQAGHPHPILMTQTGTPELKGDGGMPIGLLPDAEFESFEVQLTPGDRLFLYSDGITEAEDRENAQLGEAHLQKVLERHRGASGPELLDDLIWEVMEFTGDGDFDDDISMLVFDFEGLPAQS